MVNFPTRIPDCDSHSPALLDFFLSSDASMFYNDLPSIGKFWSCCCLGFHWLSIKFKTRCPVSWHSLWLFSCWLGWSSWSFERRSMGRYFSTLLLLLLVNFVSGSRLELMSISLIENIRSSLTHLHGFQPLVLLSYFIEITFFRLHQKDKSSDSKVKFRQASNRCKRVLEAAKLAYTNKTKESITSQLMWLLMNC